LGHFYPKRVKPDSRPASGWATGRLGLSNGYERPRRSVKSETLTTLSLGLVSRLVTRVLVSALDPIPGWLQQ
jgi:hypothetical protein